MALLPTLSLQTFTLWCKQYLTLGDQGPHGSSSTGQGKGQTRARALGSAILLPHMVAVPHNWLFIKWEVKKSSPKKPRRIRCFCPCSPVRCVDGPGWRDAPRPAVFLGDDSGGSASCPLLELGHLQSNGDQGSQHDLRETQTEEPFPSLL